MTIAGNLTVRYPMKNHKKALRKFLPKAEITDDKAELEAYKDIVYSDGPPKTWLVVKPSDYKEVSKLLRYCNDNKVAVVPWGGGTNLSGSLSPNRDFLALDLKGLNQVLDISMGDLTVTVQAGATIEKVEHSLNKLALTLGHDPWSLKSATVGGAVALDSAGNLYPKYGSAGDLVLSLKVALTDGSIIDIGKEISKTSSSPHLPSLFIGSSGIFGVILEVRFRVDYLPENHAELGYAFSSFSKMFEAIKALSKAGLEPQSYIGGTLPKVAINLQSKTEQALVKVLGIKSALFVHYEGQKGVVGAYIKSAKDILKRYGKKMPDKHAEEWWQNRHTYFEMNRQLADENIYLHVYDLCIPESHVLETHKEIQKVAVRLKIKDRISHSLFTAPDAYTVALYLEGRQESKTILTEFENEVIRIVHGMGGTMARTHGLGSLYNKKSILEEEVGSESLKLLMKMKRIMDPNSILNPGIILR